MKMAIKALNQNIFVRYFTTAPIIFPLIGLFHIGFFLFLAYSWWIEDFFQTGFYYLQPIVMGLYMLFWVGACFLRKGMANWYIFLTIIMLAFYYLGPSHINYIGGDNIFQEIHSKGVLLHQAISDILIEPVPINILFCVIILIYYRRMRRGGVIQEAKAENQK